MREKSAGPLAFLVLFLASCAGSPRPVASSPDIGAELDEMGAYRRAIESMIMGAVPAKRLPVLEPAAPDHPFQGKKGTAGVVMETLRPKIGPKDTGFSRFAVILPEAPLRSTGKSTVAAGLKSPSGQSGRKSSSVESSHRDDQPSGVRATLAVADQLPPRPGTGATPATERLREIYARIGDEVEIGLEGEGFLFLGFPDRVQADGMSFKSKQARDGKTYFKFKAFSKGDYDLSFLQQDNARGRTQKETVRIHVVSEADFTAAVERQAPPQAPDARDMEPADYQYAEKLIALGKLDAALKELAKGYKETDGYANDRIAFVYLLKRDYEAAEKYYGRNLLPAGAYSNKAVIGMVRVAIQKKDSAGFFSYLKRMLAITDLNIEEPLIQGALFQMEKGEVGVALDLLAEYTRRYSQGTGIDEARFLTAQLLERDSAYRDIPRARELYRGILAEFPESRFAGSSRERLRYIEQHFYYVR